jgi:GNAT superfamily N-acetyltransferase
MPRPTSAPPPGVTIGREDYGGDGPTFVVARAEAELVERYGWLDDSELGLTAAMFDPPAGAFLVGRAGDAGPPVGGVGLRAMGPETGEVRRLWVDPDWRGRGLGRALMAALEQAAADLGHTTLQLGTGDRQPEAVALYEATGWERLTVDADAGVEVCAIRFVKPL